MASAPRSSATWSASPSSAAAIPSPRPSRSGAIDTPCSPLNTRSRRSSAAATSPSLCAALTSRAASVPVDVLDQVALVRVRPDVDERELALGVVEGGRRERLDAVELGRDRQVVVLEVLVGHGLL